MEMSVKDSTKIPVSSVGNKYFSNYLCDLPQKVWAGAHFWAGRARRRFPDWRFRRVFGGNFRPDFFKSGPDVGG